MICTELRQPSLPSKTFTEETSAGKIHGYSNITNNDLTLQLLFDWPF